MKRLRAWLRRLIHGWQSLWGRWFGELPLIVEFDISTRQSRLRGVRYPARGGQPIVLVHGVLENTRIWSDLGKKLREAGFDVWMVNLRGKGNGTHRSTVKGYRKGMYGFDYMVTEDAPAIIEHVFARTKRKLVVCGHSLGAMVLSKTLAGVARDRAGRLHVDPGRAAELNRKVAGYVNMGGPVHFKSLPGAYRFIATVLKPFTEKTTVVLPSISGNRAPTLPDAAGFLARGKRALFAKADLPTSLVLPKGIMNTKNLDPARRELARLLEKALSPFHADIADDMARWAKTGAYTSADGFDYEKARPIGVPALVIAGDQDELAPPEHLFREARALGANGVARTALMVSTSHVDLVYGERAARLAVGAIRDFAADPVAFGDAEIPVLLK